MLESVKDFLYDLVHNYKFVTAVAAIAALVVQQLSPELAEVVSEEVILGVLLTLLGIGAGNKYAYNKVQSFRK